ncbi:hypothetical protein UA08_01110 [Talaromyces atroroseus]|uniref:Uncharacterized protein n=1 Tax=Talaromyces atroroseus TaxID=1441469 RepID=A0A225AZL6_TALAT|nr:hypothetical protein UA08_01110 [Talaromyces atroroseus]OKL63894.1 hypothetical protein UA08_01110 [Talaromyces atroroseus]
MTGESPDPSTAKDQEELASSNDSQKTHYISNSTSDTEEVSVGSSNIDYAPDGTIHISPEGNTTSIPPPHEYGNTEPESGNNLRLFNNVEEGSHTAELEEAPRVTPGSEAAAASDVRHQEEDPGLEMGRPTISLNDDKHHDTSALDDISEYTAGRTSKTVPASFKENAIGSSDEASGQSPSGESFPEGIRIYHLHEGPEERTVVDVVAVHGLGGHVEHTWKHPENDMWLRDPKPGGPEWGRNARIMAFGYQTQGSRIFTIAENLLSDLSDNRMRERVEYSSLRDPPSSRANLYKQEKRRSIVFIGHCLGGIIIKAALAHAHNHRSQFKNIIESTRAIVFFATPHHGSSRENWLHYIDSLEGVINIERRILDELCTWSQELVTRTAGFSNIASRLDITTFYATGVIYGRNRILNFLRKVVHEGSARLGLLEERVASLNASHQDICRFRLTDDNYRRVSKRLHNIIRSVKANSLKTSLGYSQLREDCINSLETYKSRDVYHNHEALAATTWKWIQSQGNFKLWHQQPSGIFLLSGELGYNKSILTERIAPRLLNGNMQAIVFDAWTPDQQQNEAKIIQTLLRSALKRRESFIEDLEIIERYQELSNGANERVEWPCNVLRELLNSLLFYECREPTYVIIDARHEAAERYVSGIVELLRKATSQTNRFNFKVLVTFRHDNLRLLFPSETKHVSLDCVEGLGRTIFQWILFAKEPLRLDELRVGVNLGRRESNSPILRDFEIKAREACHELIYCDGDFVYVVDPPSTRDYLIEKIISASNQGGPMAVQKSSHSAIARRCLEYLTSQPPYDDRGSTEPFGKYAMQYWSTHTNEAPDGLGDLVRKLAIHENASYYCCESRKARGIPNSKDLRVLHIASELGHEIVVDELKTSKDLNSRDDCGRTPLLLAIMNGHKAVVEVLLKQPGIDVNKEDDETFTALSLAAKNGQDTICRLLLDKRADANKKTNGLKPVYIAALHGHENVVSILIGATENGPDNGIDPTFLHLAAREGSKKAVVIFLKESPKDIETADSEGRTPLYLAMQENRPQVASLLATELHKRGTEINDMRTKKGQTLLSLALEKGSPRATDLLLAFGADANGRDSSGDFPLHVAVKGVFDDVKLVLDYGGSVNQTNRSGKTPLHVAAGCQNSAVEIIEFLIERNADVTARDANGDTPLHAAAGTGGIQVVQVLLNHGGYAVNARNRSGQTPLHKAASGKYAQVVRTLIMYGANLELQDYQGRTPLHAATVEKESNETIKILLRAGANKEARDYQDQTAKHIAEKGDSAQVVLELRAGIPPIPENDEEWHMQACISLQNPPFFPKWNEEALSRCEVAAQRVKVVMQEYNVNSCYIPALFKLTRYNIVILCDNSRSIETYGRQNLLETTLLRIAEITADLTGTGASVRFLNGRSEWNDLNVQDIKKKVNEGGIMYFSNTRLGSRLDKLVIKPMHLNPKCQKPIMTIIITDGKPHGEPESTLQRKILEYKRHTKADRKSIFLFSQVGSDAAGTAFLKEVERDNGIKDMVFCSQEKLDELLERAKGAESDVDKRYASLLIELFSAAVANRIG